MNGKVVLWVTFLALALSVNSKFEQGTGNTVHRHTEESSAGVHNCHKLFYRLETLPLKRELLDKARTSLSSERKYIPYTKENHLSRKIKKKVLKYFIILLMYTSQQMH
jgi:ribosomal protein L34E